MAGRPFLFSLSCRTLKRRPFAGPPSELVNLMLPYMLRAMSIFMISFDPP